MKEYRPHTIIPETENVLKRLNYNPKKTNLDERTLELIRKYLDESKDFIHPSGLSKDFEIVDITDEYFSLEKGKKIYSKKLASILRNSKNVSIIVATVGSEISVEVEKNLEEEDFTKAVILDAIGSESVEAFVENIQGIISQEKRLFGLKPTMRFSPGYGDLSLEYQSYFLNLLESQKIGVGFNPHSFILIPEKSITAIIGWER